MVGGMIVAGPEGWRRTPTVLNIKDEDLELARRALSYEQVMRRFGRLRNRRARRPARRRTRLLPMRRRLLAALTPGPISC